MFCKSMDLNWKRRERPVSFCTITRHLIRNSLSGLQCTSDCGRKLGVKGSDLSVFISEGLKGLGKKSGKVAEEKKRGDIYNHKVSIDKDIDRCNVLSWEEAPSLTQYK